MTAIAPQRITAEQFLAMPAPADGRRRELIEGEVVVLTQPKPLHQLALLNLVFAIKGWTAAAPDRGFVTLPIDTGVDQWNVLAPDLQWYAADRELPPLERGPWPLGDLVVEVRSPSTWARDVGVKRQVYERSGAAELWLVDPPSASVLALRRSGDGTAFDPPVAIGGDQPLTSPLLPGFAVAASALFR
ncbi:Uma2 family endonuclease [Patulibacter defluvii]|uniref:Uma2 family endonuclease n=1 Tax=Patulibacter defluvii TaxID=3095358 RepID=UPI002A7497D5|nr:Uma2 family endonuclease [Patulibacter sp. DM4]